MKNLMLIFLMFVTLGVQAQSKEVKKDSTVQTASRDTVRVPVYVIDRVDTVKVQTLLYKGVNGEVRYCEPGYVIVQQKVATQDGKTFKPISEPKAIGAMDNRRRNVSPIIQ